MTDLKLIALVEEVAGRWLTREARAVVEFHPCAGAEATLCGRIVWLAPPTVSEGPPFDSHNPDPVLRTRPILGIEIVRGLRQTRPGVWSGGELYNPEDGRIYSGAIKLKDGALELRGCAFRIFCQTQTWRPAASDHPGLP